ncbi:MAG TPA: hypothetical protein VIV40_21835, partial [Kofleriaceae bacterium]
FLSRVRPAPFFDEEPPWLGARRAELIRRYVTPGNHEDDDGVGESVVALTFFAPADEQWAFIRELIAVAPNDDSVLRRIAAGPVEGLLGQHGATVIERVEALAERDAKFRRILTWVWQHTMPDEIWERVCVARTGRN